MGPPSGLLGGGWSALHGAPLWALLSALSFAGFTATWYMAYAVASLAPQWRDKLAASRDSRGRCELDKFRSSFVALVHAYAVGFAALHFGYTAVATGELEPSGAGVLSRVGNWRLASACVSTSNGYMLYDLFSMIRLDLFSEVPFMLVHVHHVVVMVCFTSAQIADDASERSGAPLHMSTSLALCLTCEVNNGFLLSHKLWRQAGYDVATSLVARIFDALFVVSAVLLRLLLHTWIAFQMLQHREVMLAAYFYLSFFGTLAIIGLDASLCNDFWSSRKKIYLKKKRT